MKTKLIMIATLLLSGIMLSCQSQSRQQSQQEYADEGEPEPTDPYVDATPMWNYCIILKEDKAENPADDYKHAGGMKYDAMTLKVGDQDAEYKDEDNYAGYARIFYLATRLSDIFSHDADTYPSSQQWSDFVDNVLRACRFDPPLFHEIKDKKWRERAKELWYDKLDNKPIYLIEKRYRFQSFQIGNGKYDPQITIRGANVDNNFSLNEGSFLII